MLNKFGFKGITLNKLGLSLGSQVLLRFKGMTVIMACIFEYVYDYSAWCIFLR
mgnify:CR=1 FL=1